MEIRISDIEICSRKRRVNNDKVVELVNSIQEIGLLQPIAVMGVNGNYRLVAGMHRIEAFKALGRDKIPATVVTLDELDVELAEIDENLCKANLTVLEESLHIARRKEIYEAKYPETKHGVIGRGREKSVQVEHSIPERFTVDTAKRTDKSEAVIKRQAQIGKALAPYADDLYGTVVEDNQSELLALARMDETERAKAVEQIKKGNKPHISHNSGENEWYTPQEYIDAARKVMGGIDLDPASTELANTIVKAKIFYDLEQNGLNQEWAGRVWMNPPYAGEWIGKFCSKLVESVLNRSVEEAIVLVNNATETRWFNELISVADAVCFPSGRVQFWHPYKISVPLQGQAVI